MAQLCETQQHLSLLCIKYHFRKRNDKCMVNVWNKRRKSGKLIVYEPIGFSLHIFMKKVWKSHTSYVQYKGSLYANFTEPCSVYIPRKLEIRRSYMSSNILYKSFKHKQCYQHSNSFCLTLSLPLFWEIRSLVATFIKQFKALHYFKSS